MAYTAPTSRSTGELITASIWNVDLVADIAYLKASPTFDGLITVSGAGTSTFSAATATVQRIDLINTTSGTTATASYKVSAGTSNVFLFAYSQGYTTATYEVANGGALLCTTAGGLSIACTAGSSTVRVYAANTLAGTWASTGLTIPGTLGVTGAVTSAAHTATVATSINAFGAVQSSTGSVAIGLDRVGGTVTSWTIYGPTGSTDLRLFSGADRFTFTAAGSFTPSVSVVNQAGSAAAPSYTFSGDVDTGMYSDSADIVKFASNGIYSGTVISRGPSAGGEVNAPNGAFGTGAVRGSRLVAGRNSSGNGAAGALSAFTRAGNQRFLWVDNSGSDIVRIHTDSPTEDNTTVADTAGTVVGAQVSTRASKDISGEFTADAHALRTIRKTPLWKFRYKSRAYNNQRFVGITTDDSPIFGMDKGRSFNPVTTAAYLMAAVKELARKLDKANAQIATLRANHT